ncbi:MULTISPECIES: NUDIX hydrolase [unclassified Nocardioides]|uniref:NUDIX hydrolase n=1 Tax=unclassified Nocardioides TaxID=2615069 RepID=UPI0009F0A076|nr:MULTISPECIES: NUDIX domain-containing protein [unclassified Nocardioides]GAW51681.1 MutT/NUDIX family phosphohydrolase [Nocardioides sp. PD653-B2]GAW55351.1 MutT/NUDIX family phosphohydrolase [Nocardioides sp. PD653]
MTDQPHYTEYDTRLGAYAVVVDTVDGRAQVLLALWNEPSRPQWTLPGGGVDLDETVEEGAVRELREETGYDVELVRLLGVDTWVIPVEDRTTGSRRPLRNVRVIFEARIVGGELTHEVDGSTDEAQWFPVDEVAGLDRVALVDVGMRMAGLSPGRAGS